MSNMSEYSHVRTLLRKTFKKNTLKKNEIEIVQFVQETDRQTQ